MTTTLPTTTITYERNAMMALAHLRFSDGSHNLVYALLPCGRPRFADGATRGRVIDISVDEAPTLYSFPEFKQFVEGRWGS